MGSSRTLIDTSTKIICFLKKGQKKAIPDKGTLIKVNLGSAMGVAPGWVNVDGSLNAFFSKWPLLIQYLLYKVTGSKNYYSFEKYHDILKKNWFIHHNLEYGIPLFNSCADYIYSSHFLEHLTKEKGHHLLQESFRVLKQGGKIRIAVPDLEFALNLFEKGQKQKMLDDYFFVEKDGSYFAQHKYMYDFEMLKNILEEVGFRDVTRCSFQKGHVPDIEILDNRPDETLFVEADKP